MNRFYKSINTAEYVHRPLDLIYQTGQAKEKDAEDFVSGIQDQLDSSANYETVYSPDTDYKVQKSNNLLNQVNELGSANLFDPLVKNKIRSAIGEFTNDREVLAAIQRTNAYAKWQETKNKLGKDYAPQNDPFLQLSQTYETTGDKNIGDQLRVFQGIDPYFDTDKQIHTTLSKDNVKLDKNMFTNGIYFVTNSSNNGVTAYQPKVDAKGNVAKDGNGDPILEPVPGETKLNNALRTLPLEFYDQMRKDYDYYYKDSKMSYSDYINNYLRDALIAATQQEHELSQRSADWARLAWDQQKDLESQQLGTPLYVPGVPQQLNSGDLKNAIRSQFGITNTSYDPKHPFTSGNVSTTGLFFGIAPMDGEQPITSDEQKKYDNYISNLKTQITSGLSKQINSPQVKNVLASHNLKFENGKLSGSDGDIEDFYVSALQNSNTNAMDSYTLPNLDPTKLSDLFVALARSGHVQLGVNGSAPSDAVGARSNLLSDITANNGFAMTINPTGIFGMPTIDVQTQPDAKGQSTTYNIGLDQTSGRYFQGVVNLTNSMIKGETGKEIPIWSIPVKEGNADVIAINSFKIDQNGQTYIGTDTYLKNPKTGDLVPYSDYKSILQGIIVPTFENSNEMYPYTRKANKTPMGVQ